jgi:transcription elongation GreA/GreB family factor/very-short-patch-repair endonuclease
MEQEQQPNVPEASEPGPATRADDELFAGRFPIQEALAKLRLRLLDLTSRNRLLNFKHSAGKSLQLVDSSTQIVFARIIANQGAMVAINPVPEPQRDRWVNVNGRLVRPEVREHAKFCGIDASLELQPSAGRDGSGTRSLHYPDDLARHCRKLAREARSAIEETGANMLFLVVGFLEFPDREDSDRTMMAPLISVPVTVETKGVDSTHGQERFVLKYTGEDLAENLSLSEKLAQEYGFQLPEFDEESSPECYFKTIEELIGRKPRWRVRRQMTIALLSFSKMLLVRDLDPKNWPTAKNGSSALMDHKIVRMVFEGAPSEASVLAAVADEHKIDGHHLQDLPLIYNADSSQHSALIDALSGKNLVVEGPPGTGKSQTITNLIAAALADGKTILFVAEKLAALEVVKKRLTLAGLAPFCLELHSNKTQKKHVIEELERRRNAKFPQPPGLTAKLETLNEKRTHLAAYADLMNGVHGNACELTVHQVLWRAERYRQACTDWTSTQELYVADAPSSTEATFRSRFDALTRLAEQYRDLKGYGPDHPFWGLLVEDLLPGTDLQIEAILKEFLPRFQAMVHAFDNAKGCLGGGSVPVSPSSASTLLNVLMDLAPADDRDVAYELLPRAFTTDDPEGQQAQATLAVLGQRLNKVASCRAQIDHRLFNPKLLNRNDGARATELRAALDGLRLLSCTLHQLSGLRVQLATELARAGAALNKVESIGVVVGENYGGDSGSMRRIAAIVEAAATAPRDLLRFRHPGVAHPNALSLLGRARSEFEALSRETSALHELFYLDSVDAAEVADAVSTLRQGATWYRPFESSWRKACRIHRKLVKNKTRQPASARLQGLERLHGLLKGTKEWRESVEYREILGPFRSEAEPEFGNAERLARWRSDARTCLVDAGLGQHAVALLDGEEARLVAVAALADDLKTSAETLYRLETFLRTQLQLTPAVGGGALFACEVWSQRMDLARSIEKTMTDALKTLTAWAPPEMTAEDVLRAVEASVKLPLLIVALESDKAAKALLGERYAGERTRLDVASAALAYGRNILQARLPAEITSKLLSAGAVENHQTLTRHVGELTLGWAAVDDFQQKIQRLGALKLEAWAGKPTDSPDLAIGLAKRTANAVENRERLLPWVQYLQAAAVAKDRGLGDFVQKLESGAVSADGVANAYGYRFFGSIAHAIFSSHRELSRFAGVSHERARSEYAELDRDIIRLRGGECARNAANLSSPPGGQQSPIVGDKTEMALVKHMMAHPRARVTLRRMLSQAGRAVQALKPCFMMGPQAVAQYLAPTAVKFDIVIMDEASQLKPEEAIGSIARGSQLIVVGDPKQLPPTNFFDRLGTTADEGDETAQAAAVDSESILEVCMGHFHPVRTLRWHYRSLHESLIAFSNNRFYRNRLLVFPSPYGKNNRLGLRYHYIKEAIYESQTNRAEAARVVDAALDHMVNHAEDSLGIVTLNLRQRDLIEEMLDQRCRNFRKTEEFKMKWEAEGLGVFVKNLESVQGDERDVILISTTYGRAPNTDVVRQNFGPISRQTGWRRLNVLFTRARRSVHLFSSMQPEDIVVDEGTPAGTRALREYLEFAKSGVLAEVGPTGGAAESDFEAAVTEVLEDAGFEVVPQLGVAGFRIDIAVKHPKRPTWYFAAIECDGASYHSGVSVRDRDRIRQELLESMGWEGRIWRIWSTDWFRNPRHEANRMLDFLRELLGKELPDVYVDAETESVAEIEQTEAATMARATQSATPRTNSKTTGEAPPSQASLNLAESTILIDEEQEQNLEAEVGDLVTYVPTKAPEQHVSVRLTKSRTDIANGFLAETAPLAQALLGAVVGDEVVLRVLGVPPQSFIVTRIVRAQEDAPMN